MTVGICGCTIVGLNSADVGEPTVFRRWAEAAASRLSGERGRREEGELAAFSVIKQVRGGGSVGLGGRELQSESFNRDDDPLFSFCFSVSVFRFPIPVFCF